MKMSQMFILDPSKNVLVKTDVSWCLFLLHLKNTPTPLFDLLQFYSLHYTVTLQPDLLQSTDLVRPWCTHKYISTTSSCENSWKEFQGFSKSDLSMSLTSYTHFLKFPEIQAMLLLTLFMNSI